MKQGIFIIGALAFLLSASTYAGMVEIRQNQLWVDGKTQPQIFGAELQYFRLRGGQGRNIPRAKVVELWGKALDRMVEAKMNAISFYIPWDFHEYAEGKFDFRGEVDEDGDGSPDYPSRDLLTFFRMIEERGIRHIMVRPGPYINAEWGFLGFGAIPLWFHEKYPDSHMRAPDGLRTKLYDYHSEDLLRHTQLWFAELYKQVLKDRIGPGKPISFVQVDNETNFMWQSLYNHDYGPRALARYREFLKKRYGTLEALNKAQGSRWGSWEDAQPPIRARENIPADRDWYEFQDESIRGYLKKIRGMWEELGVKEPQVLFTLAESYNATEHGLLPSYQFRNEPGIGMMTVNLYPKTYELASSPLLNLPFKADHDVKSAETASDLYLGRKEEWVMGPEIQGGWWRGTKVSPEARRQTYLTTLGHGLKALFVYYFNEGDNWDGLWQKEAVRPFYTALRTSDAYKNYPERALPGEFWTELQGIVDRKLLKGIPVHHVWHQSPADANDLFFDAPLDKNGEPRAHFYDLKNLAEKIAPYGAFLGKAVAVEDRVCILRDAAQHLPSLLPGLDSVWMNGEWAGGLLAYVMQTGVNPRILHWGIQPEAELESCALLFYQDNGSSDPALAEALARQLNRGAMVVNFVGDSLAKNLGFLVSGARAAPQGENWVRFGGRRIRALSNVLYSYDLSGAARCQGLLYSDSLATVGYECPWGVKGGSFVQIGAVLYHEYNSNAYGQMQDSADRLVLMQSLLAEAKAWPRFALADPGQKITVFARTVDDQSFWITTKTGSPSPVEFAVRVKLLDPEGHFSVRDLWTGETQFLTGMDLAGEGFQGKLEGNGSKVYFLEKMGRL